MGLNIKKKLTPKFMWSIGYSILFSLVFYFMSLYIINSYVLPQFEKIIKTSLQEIHKELEKYPGEEITSKTYKQLVGWLTDNQKNFQVENVYILKKEGEKEYVVAANESANAPQFQPYPFTESMKQTLADGKIRISSIYKDDYGIHKSGFMKLTEDLILGIDIDSTFIARLHVLMACIFIILTIAMCSVYFLIGSEEKESSIEN